MIVFDSKNASEHRREQGGLVYMGEDFVVPPSSPVHLVMTSSEDGFKNIRFLALRKIGYDDGSVVSDLKGVRTILLKDQYPDATVTPLVAGENPSSDKAWFLGAEKTRTVNGTDNSLHTTGKTVMYSTITVPGVYNLIAFHEEEGNYLLDDPAHPTIVENF